MSDSDYQTVFRLDEIEDLWWVFYLTQSASLSLGHQLVEAMSQRGNQLVHQQYSEPFFVANMHNALSDTYFELSNSADGPRPFFFLGMKADVFLPPEASSSLLKADLFLKLGKICFEILRPKYAFAENLNVYVTMTDVDESHITHMCWANFFGPAFAKGLGRDILLNAPAWRTEVLRSGGILYVLAASPFLYRGPDQCWETARQYFRKRLTQPIIWSDEVL